MASSAPLVDHISGLLNLEGLLGEVVSGILGSLIIAVIVLLFAALAGPYMKRKITSAFTDRISVDRVGPYGIGTIAVDAIRLLTKERIVPENVDRPAWDLGPMLVVISATMGFAVIPFGSGLHLADPSVGVVYLFAVSSIASLGMVSGAYASNNKYSFLGGLRAVSQNIAYEIPLVLTGASVVIFAGSLRISDIVAAQAVDLISLGPIAIPAWFGFVNPFAFALFMAANMAEIGRNPFDLPEAPNDLVAGYQTEYSSVYFVLFYLGEFLHIFLGAGIITTLFLGGPTAPITALNFIPGIVWFIAKVWGVFFFTQWARSAVPRVRPDQLLDIGWKGMLGLAFVNLLLTAVIVGVIV
ncbi:NADH-quinone oxidoreductase subunit H [Halodesulfurarchaeum formicicum]|uniref:NADH-quinone oxidoreductase subunit H n=1 Tax=Halodesulfurarchaeum formicicum TaxID=1873524 RepID=A0A1D8S4R7_9EURY|nr:complex I subunit 1 family protein [Halodesulfurarchaeum formicicum]AOW80358.1 NADH-quinone oxidoreductase subunit H [Halodesulfurarchaeum formicicum]APE95661.1 NADH-quinone oxidoreductase subunit H [Halodesulfurarchaeum formicicum]